MNPNEYLKNNLENCTKHELTGFEQELFSFVYFFKYLSLILKVYKPGVNFQFSIDDIIIEKLINVPIEETNHYIKSFEKLLDIFRQYFPHNFNVTTHRISNLYPDRNEFNTELEKSFINAKKDFENKNDKEKNDAIKRSALNIKWDGVQNWTNFSAL